MHFAARTDFGSGDSAYGKALANARARGTLIDLTVSNPTRCGFSYPADLLLPLQNEQVLRYDPDPIGVFGAREAVSQLYRAQYGADVSPENVVLTASTSEAYGYLLRLFCEPGGAILVPSPSYPLFDLLAQMHDVEVVTYPLVYHDGWQIDPSSLRAAVTPRTRAIVAVHPNNPTGHYCSEADRQLLLQCAEENDLPLIVDEVFLDYAINGAASPSFSIRKEVQIPSAKAALIFVLGGLSKLLCLPQMKLAWTVVCGQATDVSDAMQRLEVIADTFLSVGAPAQVALPAWLQQNGGMRRQVMERVQTNLFWLDSAIAGTAVSRLRVDGGWSVVLRIPANDEAVDLVVRLLKDQSVAMHPGSFYGFPARGSLVVSLLTPCETFAAGIDRLLQNF